MEFIGAAEEAGAGDVVGEVGVDRGDEQGNIDRIVGTVGIDENTKRSFDVGDGEPERGAFAEAGVADDAGPGGLGDRGGGIGGAALDDDDVTGVVEAFADDGGDGGGFVAGGDDGGDGGIRAGLGLGELTDGDLALSDHAPGAEGDEAVVALAETEDFGLVGGGKGRTGAGLKGGGATPGGGEDGRVGKRAERGRPHRERVSV